jgi:hypothetical protein
VRQKVGPTANSGLGDQEDKRRSWEAGFDHLVKPVEAATLEKLRGSSQTATG